MAKKNDDFDEFGDDAASTKPAAKSGGGLGGILAKLPLAGVVDKLKGGVDNVKTSVSSSFGDQDKPTLPIILLGGGVVILVMVLIVMIVLLVGSLSKSAEKSPLLSSTQSKQPENVAIVEPAASLSPDQEAPLVSSGRPAEVREPLTDPYFRTAILPDEFALMRDGEIRYGREPAPNWNLDDIRPGWQELNQLYKVMLREQNSRDFFKLLGAKEPIFDTY